MMMMTTAESKNWIEKIWTGPAIVTLIVALFGQAIFSVVWQIRNNEQQSARIDANFVEIKVVRESIYSMATPLAQRVFKVEDRLDDLARRLDDYGKKVDALDLVGSRALGVVSNNQQRLMAQTDRLAERVSAVDRRLGDLDFKSIMHLQNQIEAITRDVKRLDEQQVRIIQALDNTYNTLTEFMRQPPVIKPRGNIINPETQTGTPP